MDDEPKNKISFAEFELDAGKRRLTRDGNDVRLTSKAFDLLVFLTENSHRILSKNEILDAVWDGQFVEEANLAVQISALRKALNDKKENPRFLLTVPGKGYEFVADIQTDEEIIIENRKYSRLTIEQSDVENFDKTETKKKLPPAAPFRLSSNSKLLLKISAVAFAVLLTASAAAFWFWRGKESKANEPPKFTRLTTSGRITAATLSPDGRYAVFAQKDADGESLWLRQIETGSQTQITPTQNLEHLGLSVSPDGNFIYTPVFIENRAKVPLWKIPFLGGAAEEIPGIETSASVGFSPDGKRFAYIEHHQPETHLKIADADGSNPQAIVRANYERRAFPIWKANPAVWSPDGKTIAAAFEEKNENGSLAGVLLVDSTNANEQILVQPRWNFIDDAAWLDTENLIFIGYDDEWSNEIFTVNIRSGEIRQITDDLQNYRYLAITGNEVLTIQSNAVSGIYEADFKEDLNAVQPREIFRESGYISNVALGKNGAIFYSSRSTGEPEIWRIEADGTNAAPLTSGSHINFGLAVSPSDDSLIYCSYENGKFALRAVDGNGKNPRSITDGVDHITPDISAEGKIVFQSFSQKILKISANEKTPVELANGLKPVLSPDGRRTAFFAMDENRWRIILISTDTGEILKKLDLPTVVNQRRMQWHPSGKFLTLFFNTGEKLKLLLLPVEEGEPRIVEGFGTGDLNSFGWTEDGKKLIYSLTKETRDAVLLSGF